MDGVFTLLIGVEFLFLYVGRYGFINILILNVKTFVTRMLIQLHPADNHNHNFYLFQQTDIQSERNAAKGRFTSLAI